MKNTHSELMNYFHLNLFENRTSLKYGLSGVACFMLHYCSFRITELIGVNLITEYRTSLGWMLGNVACYITVQE